MEDRTKDQLDALADLFLTGVKPTATGGNGATPPAGRSAPPAASQTPSSPQPQPAPTPALRPARSPAPMARPMPAPPLRTTNESAAPAPATAPAAADPLADPLDAPRPLRLPPKMRTVRMPGGPRTFMPPATPAADAIRAQSGDDGGEGSQYGYAESMDDAGASPAATPPSTPGASKPRVWRHRAAGGRVVKAADAAALEKAERPVRIEAVFLGNLPGFGRPWLTQYAHFLAQRGGRVAILHIEAGAAGAPGEPPLPGYMEVEVVTAGAAPTDPPIPALHLASEILEDAENGDGEAATAKPPIDPASLAALLDSLTRPGPMRVSRVLVHLPGADAARELGPAMDLRRWTVLSGADDAAIAGAARLIQRLAQIEVPATDQSAGGPPPRRIGVMVMGSDQDRAQGAAQRISASVTDAAPEGVRLVGAMRQMVPVNVRVLGSFTADPAAGGVITLWRSALATLKEATRPNVAARKRVAARRLLRRIAAAGATASPVAAEPPAPAAAKSAEPSATRSSSRKPTGSSRPPEPDNAFAAGLADGPTVTRILETVTEAAINNAAAWHIFNRSEPAGAAAPRTVAAAAPASSPFTPPPTPPLLSPAVDDEIDLSQHLIERGLIQLDARSPRHPHAQLVLDQHGCVHLLARHTGDPGAGDLRDTIIELLSARAWFLEHRGLIALTQRQCRFADADPVLHLFTDQPKLALGLAQRLGDHLKLHILQRVGAVWYSTELN